MFGCRSRSTLFPYTTLFRSGRAAVRLHPGAGECHGQHQRPDPHVYPVHGALRSDDHRGGRPGRQRPGAQGRRKAVHQGMTADPYAAATASAARLAELTGQPAHDVAVVLGSGWAAAADALSAAATDCAATDPGAVMTSGAAEVPLAELGGFAPPTVAGHLPTADRQS